MVVMGALTSKIYSFEARPWELKKERGMDPFEGKEILFEMRGLTILRAFPREGWISDKIRVILDAFQLNRLLLPKKGVVEKTIHQWSRIFFFLFFRQERGRGKAKRELFFPLFYEFTNNFFLFEEKKKRSAFLVPTDDMKFEKRNGGREAKYD